LICIKGCKAVFLVVVVVVVAVVLYAVKANQLMLTCVFDANQESHVSHLDNVSQEELNRLLSMVVDVENLFTCVHKEEDVDTKQVYFYLFRVRK